MYCSACGKPVPDGAAFCSSCGTTVQAAGAAGAAYAAPSAPAIPADAPSIGGGGASAGVTATVVPARYAGFWRRFWAAFVDGCILGLVMMPFSIGLWGSMAALGEGGHDNVDAIAALFAASMMAWMLRGLASWLYGALFESSAWQATPGKKLLGLQVTDLEGRRISFLRATGRAFGKWLSGLIFFIGYIMVAFTEKKQGLHDMLAGTVVRR